MVLKIFLTKNEQKFGIIWLYLMPIIDHNICSQKKIVKFLFRRKLLKISENCDHDIDPNSYVDFEGLWRHGHNCRQWNKLPLWLSSEAKRK
jgi:hypothetical protein